MPANIIPKIIVIITRVVAAFFAFGDLKNGTALEIASTPVSEADPLVKARNNKITVTPEIVCPT